MRIRQKSVGFVSEPASDRSRLSWQFYVLVALSALPFIFVSGFRSGIGTDYYHTYYPLYDKFISGQTFQNCGTSPATFLLGKILTAFQLDHVWFFVITASITILFFFIGIYQQSNIPWMSVLLFVITEAFFISLNAVNQCMGLALVFFALKYIRKPCFWKYAVFVILGSLFHLSVIIFLPLYFFSKITFPPWVGLVAVGVSSLLNQPLRWLLSVTIQYTRYGRYLETDFQTTTRLYPLRLFIHILVLAAAFYCYQKSENRNNLQYRFLYHLELCAFFLLINRNIIPLSDRLCWSFEIGQLLLIPHIIQSIKEKELRIIVAICFLSIWGLVCYIEIWLSSYHEVFPYQSVLFP